MRNRRGARPQPKPEANEARQVSPEPAEVERPPGVDGGPDVALDVDVATQVGLAEGVSGWRPEHPGQRVGTVDDHARARVQAVAGIAVECKLEPAARRQGAPDEPKYPASLGDPTISDGRAGERTHRTPPFVCPCRASPFSRARSAKAAWAAAMFVWSPRHVSRTGSWIARENEKLSTHGCGPAAFIAAR